MKFNDRYIPFSKKGKEAREEFRRNKNVAIKDLKAMQEGTYMNATAIEQNAIIQDGSSQQEWVMNNAIASKGYGLKEGQYAGISAKSFYKDVDGEQRQHFMLMKDGKEVPNCVPLSEMKLTEENELQELTDQLSEYGQDEADLLENYELIDVSEVDYENDDEQDKLIH